MNNKHKLFVIIAMVVVISFSMVSCDTGGGDSDPPPLYIITGSGASFTATRGGAAIPDGSGVIIANVISAIRSHAGGIDVTIQFGSNGENLNLGTGTVSLDNTSGTWGHITLQGSISTSSIGGSTITVGNGVSVISTGTITNTHASGGGGLNNSGTVHISDGTVQANGGTAIFIQAGQLTFSGGEIISGGNPSTISMSNAASRLNMSGGTVRNTSTGAAVEIQSAVQGDAVIISGGTVEAGSGSAINSSNGHIIISQDHPGTPTIIRSSGSTNATIHLANATNGTLEIKSGKVENTGDGGVSISVNSGIPATRVTALPAAEIIPRPAWLD